MTQPVHEKIGKPNLKTFIDLVRPFTLLMPFVGFVAGSGIGYFAIKPENSTLIVLVHIIMGAFAASILNAASNIINQYYDFDIDAINKPERPLPSLRMSKPEAIRIGIGAYILAIILAGLINTSVLVVVIITALITFFYSAPPIRFKNNPILANLAMAIPRGLLLPVAGWVAIHPDKPFVSIPWAIGSILFLYVLGAASTKDYADMKGDKACGAITLPVLLGIRKSAWVISPFFIFPFLLIPIFIRYQIITPTAYPLTVLAVWGVYISWMILRNPESLALEGNHPSWKHMYLLTMVAQLGFLASYIIDSAHRLTS